MAQRVSLSLRTLSKSGHRLDTCSGPPGKAHYFGACRCFCLPPHQSLKPLDPRAGFASCQRQNPPRSPHSESDACDWLQSPTAWPCSAPFVPSVSSDPLYFGALIRAARQSDPALFPVPHPAASSTVAVWRRPHLLIYSLRGLFFFFFWRTHPKNLQLLTNACCSLGRPSWCVAILSFSFFPSSFLLLPIPFRLFHLTTRFDVFTLFFLPSRLGATSSQTVDPGQACHEPQRNLIVVALAALSQLTHPLRPRKVSCF